MCNVIETFLGCFFAYTSIKKMLMVISGKETNPGPSMMDKEDMLINDDDVTEDVMDLNMFSESTEILKTSRVKCDICGVGDIIVLSKGAALKSGA